LVAENVRLVVHAESVARYGNARLR
jgi:hypothetical protein